MRGQEDVGYLLWPASVVLAGMLEDVRGEVLEVRGQDVCVNPRIGEMR